MHIPPWVSWPVLSPCGPEPGQLALMVSMCLFLAGFVAACVVYALETRDGALRKASAAVGVSLMETQHPAFSVEMSENSFISPLISGSFDAMPRRQDLKPIYALDGSLYLSSVEALYSQKSFCHDKTLGMIFDRYKSFEVDDLVDFLCIEAVLEYREKSGLPTVRSGENL